MLCCFGKLWIEKGVRGDEIQFSSVQFSPSVMSNSLRPHESQHAMPPCPSPTPGVYSNSCPSSWWCHPAISSSVVPFSSCPQSLQHQGLFQWVNSSHEVAKVLEFQLQHQSFQWTPRTDLLQDGLVRSPCSPRDSQESPPGLKKTIPHSLRLDSRNGILDVKLFLPGSSNSF